MPPKADLTALDPTALWARYGESLAAGAFNVVAALAILVAGLWVSGAAADWVRRASQRNPRVDTTLAAFFASIIRYVFLAVVAVAVLDRFGVQTTQVVAVLGAATLAIGLALQGTLSNVAAGVMLILFRPYRLGDFVEVAGQRGVVKDVNIFTTELATPDNIKIVLPNGQCWGAPISNLTFHDQRRLEITVGVAYDANLDKAIGVVRRAIGADPRVLTAPETVVQVSALGDFAVTLQAYFWCRTSDVIALRPVLLKAVKEALDAAGVAIPFPTTITYHHEGLPAAPAAFTQSQDRPR